MPLRLATTTVCLAGALLCAAVGTPLAAHGEEMIHVARARRLARDVRPAVVRIQWRPRKGADEVVVERHAVVVDPEGWLLMAGPPPSPRGTLAATFDDGRAMGAEVWASDARSSLTLLRVPVTHLPPLSLRDPPPRPEPDEAKDTVEVALEPMVGELPPRLAPGFPFIMVTADGAVARGVLRANHRRRAVEDPLASRRVALTCLDEAALNVVATDLGAPWLDEEGRIVGLLVGADMGHRDPVEDGDGVSVRPEITAAYAVPAEVIRLVWPLLKVQREVPRGVLGVRVRPLSDASRQHLCPGCAGYEVTDLAPSGPAHHAGIELLDVIRSVDGRTIAPDADLADVLLPHRPGDRIRIGVLRRGEEKELEIVLSRGR